MSIPLGVPPDCLGIYANLRQNIDQESRGVSVKPYTQFTNLADLFVAVTVGFANNVQFSSIPFWAFWYEKKHLPKPPLRADKT